MNKILKLSLVTAFSSFLLVGCMGTPDAPDTEGSVSHSENMSSVEVSAAKLHGNLTQEKLSHIVKKAGEEAGWKMSEFKIDTFIAEKFSDDGTISTTVKFSKDAIELNPKNDDLEDAINKALGN